MSDLEERLAAIEVLLGMALGRSSQAGAIRYALDEALVRDHYQGPQTEWHRTIERVHTIALRHTQPDDGPTQQPPAPAEQQSD